MNPLTSPLLTDLYQLNMIQAYLDHGETEDGGVRILRAQPAGAARLPARRRACEQALDYLENLRFSPDDIDWLESTGRFGPSPCSTSSPTSASPATSTPCRKARVFFANEPILRVTAPLPQAQLVETRLINILHFQSLIASKAARMVLAAPGKLLVDFGLRRAHGAEAGLMAARASYIAGFAGTATVLAGELCGIPLSAPWRIPSSRPTTTRSRRSRTSPARGRRT